MATHIQADHRLDFLEIDSDVRRDLGAVAPVIGRNLGAIIDGFYLHMDRFPETRRILSGQSVDRLKQAHGRHWATLFSGVLDDGYRRQAQAVGHAHERIGLEPTWYIGGYSFVLTRLAEAVIEHHGRDRAATATALGAIIKAIMLDMDIAISVYITTAAEKRERQMGLVADKVEAEVASSVHAAGELGGRADEAVARLHASLGALLDQVGAVSAIAGETSSNVETIAAAGEQLTASVSEISRQVHHAQDTARAAVEEVGQATRTIEALKEAAAQIGQIVRLISSVASQTNLLALNATIEAARAGDMGRGFAVVAKEVKDLASQTRGATEEITRRVEAIQTQTGAAVNAMGRIAEVIRRVDQTTVSISASIEEQTNATAEIGRNVAAAAAGTRDVSRHVAGITEEVRNTHEFAAIVASASQGTAASIGELERRVSALIGGLRAYETFERPSGETGPGETGRIAQVRYNGTACQATLLTLSEGGATLGLDRPPPLDYTLQLTVPGLAGPLTGRVVEASPGRCLVRFSPQSLAAADLAAMGSC